MPIPKPVSGASFHVSSLGVPSVCNSFLSHLCQWRSYVPQWRTIITRIHPQQVQSTPVLPFGKLTNAICKRGGLAWQLKARTLKPPRKYLIPASSIHQVYDLGHITWSFWASVSSSVKWDNNGMYLIALVKGWVFVKNDVSVCYIVNAICVLLFSY